jgi:hypothetical protein
MPARIYTVRLIRQDKQTFTDAVAVKAARQTLAGIKNLTILNRPLQLPVSQILGSLTTGCDS